METHTEAHIFPSASLSKTCLDLKTYNVAGQISVHIFPPKKSCLPLIFGNIISQVWILPCPLCGHPPATASSSSVSSSGPFSADLQAEILASFAILNP